MGKRGVLEHKSGIISETRKDKRKSYCGRPIGTHKRSFEWYRPRPPKASSSPRLGVCDPHAKTPIAIISRTGKDTDLKFGQDNNRVHRNKSPLKILEIRDRGRIQGLSKFLWVPPIIAGTGKATNFKFGQYIQSVHPNKSPLKILE